MSAQNLIRWSGLLLIVVAVLIVLFGLLRLGGPNVLGQTFNLLSFMLLVLAAMGLYAAQHEQSGVLGLVAFVLSVLGAILMSASNLVTVARLSGVGEAQAVQNFYSTTVPLSIIAPLVFFGGLFLFGLATMLAGVLPRWSGILLSFGTVLAFVGNLVAPPVALLGILCIGAAFIWMGWALWSQKAK